MSADDDADRLGLGPKQRAAFFMGQAMSLLHSASESLRRAGIPDHAASARELAVKVQELARRAFPDPPAPKHG